MINQYTACDQLLLTVNPCWISQLEGRVNKVQLRWGWLLRCDYQSIRLSRLSMSRLLRCDYQSIRYVEFKDLDYKLAI